MTVRSGLLALLAERPLPPAALRSEFESRTGGTWPLNLGQVVTTLARLERDGLVSADGEDAVGRAHYRVTDAGRAAVHDWFAAPVDRGTPTRDELAIKLALAVGLPCVDVPILVQGQRAATLRSLQDYTRLKDRLLDEPDELAWLLVLESLIFSAEAEVRWLDACEARVARATRRAREASGTDTPIRATPIRATQRTGGGR